MNLSKTIKNWCSDFGNDIAFLKRKDVRLDFKIANLIMRDSLRCYLCGNIAVTMERVNTAVRLLDDEATPEQCERIKDYITRQTARTLKDIDVLVNGGEVNEKRCG